MYLEKINYRWTIWTGKYLARPRALEIVDFLILNGLMGIL
jgi:hypothetical protein